MPERAIKRGDDIPVNVRKVRLSETGQLISGAAVSWKIYDRTNTLVVGAEGDATLYNNDEAWFKLVVPKAITAAFNISERYRLDIIHVHAGIQVTKSYDLIPVDSISA